MSVILDILCSYKKPKFVQAKRMQAPESEPRALAVLFGGCALMFVAQWPILARAAHFDPSIPLNARFSGALFGWLMIAPLGFYGVALVAYLIARMMKNWVKAYDMRLALFWAILASAPVWLLAGLTKGFIGETAAYNVIGLLALTAFFVIWGAGILVAISVPKERPV